MYDFNLKKKKSNDKRNELSSFWCKIWSTIYKYKINAIY